MSSWRYIAQRASTGEFLDMELPLHRDELGWSLSGAGSLRGTIAPDIGGMRAEDGRPLLEEWGTYIYAEADGVIRWGGIVISSKYSGPNWSVEAAGFSTYPHGMPYLGDYSQVGVDPVDVVRHIWEHLQAQPGGDLGVSVVGDSTPVRLGTPPREVSFTTGAGENVAFEAGPYTLSWQEAPDCGDEIDSLVKETPFEYTEHHYWDGEEIRHELRIGYPRLGRKRDDLAFIQGDNVSALVTPETSGDDFANAVYGIGAGEGAGALRRMTGLADGRLRRVAVYTAKDVQSVARLDSRIASELRRRQDLLTISEITVRDHVNARLGSWALGDDILVEAYIPWLGDVSIWSRVTGWTLKSEDTAKLTLARSDSFTYGG